MATIGDIAAALRPYGLDPVVIRIANEPTETRQAKIADTARPPREEDVDNRTWFDDFISVFRTLVSTRSGHLDGHEAYVKNVLADEKRLIRIGVYEKLEVTDMPTEDNPLCRWDVRARESTEMKNVSMSWWMSHPVQAFIDAQLCHHENWKNLLCELKNGKAGAVEDESCWAATGPSP